MKAVLALSAASGAFAAREMTFGPKHCVSVYRKETSGTCVMKTSCDSSTNLENVEFAFTCQLPNMLQKHSFGKGGFDQSEEFDTNVKCDSCGLPQEVSLSLKDAMQKEKVVKADPKPEAVPEEKVIQAPLVVEKVQVPKTAVAFGPDSCVHTWLEEDKKEEAKKPEAEKKEGMFVQKDEESADNEKGTCQIATSCKGVSKKDFVGYSVGLVCLSHDGTPVRHLFGKQSFDPEEHFNTMIRCTSCLGLDEVSEAVTLEADVKALSRTVEKIADKVNKIEKSVGGGFMLKSKKEVQQVAHTVEAKEKKEESSSEDSSSDDDSSDSNDDDDDDE